MIRATLKETSTWKGTVSPLHFAAGLGRTEVMERLLKAGANPNA